MDTVDGCRHLREYKEEEGLDAYKTVHAWFATPVSAAARRSLALFQNIFYALRFFDRYLNLTFNAYLMFFLARVPTYLPVRCI
jgi:hypothetical protein